MQTFHFQLATGVLFIVWLVAETQLSIDSSLCDYFLVRIVLGALIGVIYLSSVLVCLQFGPSPSTYGFTIATMISITQTEVSTEISCVSLTLVYSLIALNLSSSNWLFATNHANNARLCAAFGANAIVKQTRAVIYLAGAKLLNVFCSFLPFVCIISQVLQQPSAFADVNNATDQIFNDLAVLFLTRLALGTITILLFRHNVNWSSAISLVPFTVFLAVVLLLPLFDLSHFISEFSCVHCLIALYVGLSLFVDVIGHHVALNADLELRSAPNMLSLTFATFIEHLVDVSIVVVYLNDWISAKLILTSLIIIFLTIFSHKVSTPYGTRQDILLQQTI